MTSHAAEIADHLRSEQDRLVDAFERYDGERRFRRREWRRDGLGGGRACVLEGGAVFERAGVNVSLVHGARVPPALEAPELVGKPFRATGISLVLHPRNPYAPSFHANFRYFEVADRTWWFGGGLDLTPSYGFDVDAVHFHRTLREWCDRHDPSLYPQWKDECDRYFFLRHRREMRGVGGVFFHRLRDDRPGGHERCRAVVVDGLATILPAYLPILDRRVPMPYGERERAWQLTRRGRYVEFNLVYDKGTLFGLQTDGNTEAILISMPPVVRWGFDVRPEPGSPEADTARFLQPRDWAATEPGPVRTGGVGPDGERGTAAGRSAETGRPSALGHPVAG
ncbi:oxygen-dependent coproporphyrinogen oxidase [Streptoalloteichus hindustanus]|uniref:coproporphyrinogen oxidase n=1 Tax=Streptoalloteichus hindustanus TaxID=2017 RepID=A0A1M5PPY3_STRHI|nr:oxygen-dependent coproporphyrinogen oxidase [Streptoalloteichus hindustanus]SHH03834.1 coproporphyrinogen oxidase [Streptoalloteichus hindustanus]